jgi:hypothetical protein
MTKKEATDHDSLSWWRLLRSPLPVPFRVDVHAEMVGPWSPRVIHHHLRLVLLLRRVLRVHGWRRPVRKDGCIFRLIDGRRGDAMPLWLLLMEDPRIVCGVSSEAGARCIVRHPRRGGRGVDRGSDVAKSRSGRVRRRRRRSGRRRAMWRMRPMRPVLLRLHALPESVVARGRERLRDGSVLVTMAAHGGGGLGGEIFRRRGHRRHAGGRTRLRLIVLVRRHPWDPDLWERMPSTSDVRASPGMPVRFGECRNLSLRERLLLVIRICVCVPLNA